MWIRSLHLENWMLFRDVRLDFSLDNRIIGVVGRYIDDELSSDRSNRSGKSSLVEAVKFLLYGVGRDRSHVKLINRTAYHENLDMRVSGTLVMNGGSEVKISRGRTHKGDPWVDVEGHSGAGWKKSNEYLASILGFTHNEFVNTCYFGQGDIHQFMASDSKAKRELILNWLGQERWTARQVYCSQQLTDIDLQIDSINKTLDGIVTGDSIDDLELKYNDATIAYNASKHNIKRARIRLDQLSKKINEAQKQALFIQQKEQIQSDIGVIEGQLREAREKYEIYEVAIKQKELLKQKLLEVNEKFEAKIRPLKDELIALTTKGKIVKEKFAKIKTSDGICPILETPCNKIKADLTSKKELENLRKEFLVKNKLVKKLQSNLDLQSSALNDEINEKIGIEINHKHFSPLIYEGQLNALKGELLKVKTQLPDKLIQHKKIIDKYKKAENDYQKSLDKSDLLGQEVARAKIILEGAYDIEKQMNQLKDKLGELEKKRAAWRYSKYMFGPRGIQGDYLQFAFKTMEDDVNFILDRLNVGIQVVFKPHRELKSFEELCLVCGFTFGRSNKKQCPKCKGKRHRRQKPNLVLEIIDNIEKQKSEFDLDSGGGQTMISFAVRLALLLLKIREGRNDPPPLILDEIVGNLDAYHRSAILDLVLNVLPKEYGFEQIWWISHLEEIQSALETRLLVCREGHQSEVKWI